MKKSYKLIKIFYRLFRLEFKKKKKSLVNYIHKEMFLTKLVKRLELNNFEIGRLN